MRSKTVEGILGDKIGVQKDRSPQGPRVAGFVFISGSSAVWLTPKKLITHGKACVQIGEELLDKK